MCLGGVEVANNARTYGYATTSDCPVSWFRKAPCKGTWDALNDWIMPVWQWQEVARNWTPNPSMETAGAAQALWTNLATNPSFETTSGTVEVRRNFNPNPRFVGTANGPSTIAGWALAATGGTWGASDGLNLISDTAAANVLLAYEGAAMAAAPGEVWTVSRDVSVPVGYPAVTVRLAAGPYGASGAVTSEFVYSADATIQPGQTVRLIATSAALGATVTGIRSMLYLREAASTGRRISQTNALVERTNAPDAPFDGSAPPAVRTNLATRPYPSTTGNPGWLSNNGSLYPVTNDTIVVRRPGTVSRRTDRAASSPSGVITSNYAVGIDTWSSVGRTSVKTGDVARVSFWGRASVPYRLRVIMTFYDAAGAAVGPNIDTGDSTPYAAGTWNRSPVAQAVAPVGAVTVGILSANVSTASGTTVGGEQAWMQDAMIEVFPAGTPNNTPVPLDDFYFDGGYGAPVGYATAWAGTAGQSASSLLDSDLTTAWAGTANGSPSVVNGLAVPGASTGNLNARVPIASTHWAAAGSRSVRIYNKGTAGSTPIGVRLLTSGDIGKAFTVLATYYQEGVAGVTGGEDRRINVTGTVAYSNPAPDMPGVATDLRLTFTATATGEIRLGGPGSVAATGFWDKVAIIEGVYAGPYFDGSNALPDVDMTTIWTGTPNASTSRVSGVTLDPPYWSTPSQAITLRSSMWADPGAYSIRQIPTYPTRGASYTNLASSGTPNGLVGGRTYTISATYHQAQPQGFDTPLQRLIGVSAGSPTPTIIGASEKAPDVAGSHRLSVTVQLPATDWSITLYNGGQVGDPDSWWDAVTIVDGAYDGPYFDGDSVDTEDRRYMWLGTPHASASTEEVYTLVSEGYIDGIPYTADNISDAPWYDADRADITSRFYGPFILSIEGIDDSTRSASVTEGILDGGVVGLVRHATRSVRVRALLMANGGDALDYGLAWLNAALSTSDCSQHAGGACGAVDLTFLAACPPVMDTKGRPEDSMDMLEATSALFRHLHNVTVISGPLIEQKMKSQDGRHVGLIVEWTMVAGTPWVFSESTQIPLGGGSSYTVVQDVPYNLVPYPSAELGSGSVLVATNYSANPSVETNATGWAAGGTVTPAPTGARVAELAPSGTYSYKVTASPTATGSGTVYAEQNVSLTGAPAGARVSVNMWSAAFLPVGTGSISAFKVQAIWRNGTTVVSTVDLGAVAPNGGVVSVRNIARPAATDNVTIRAVATASWTGAATLNVYADALAVTVP